MWLIGEYEAVTLFSLRLSTATSSGGKTLLAPTPYALKLALLDAACRARGRQQGEVHWPEIRDLHIALRPADMVVVTNLFQRVLKPYKNPPCPGVKDFGPFQRTIAYREYAHLYGPLGVALECEDEAPAEWLASLMMQINYLGKRGSFMQLMQPPENANTLPSGYIRITQDQQEFPLRGTLQILDDCAPSLTFAKVNVYSGEKVKEKDRVRRNIVLPYRLKSSSKSFSWYERIG